MREKEFISIVKLNSAKIRKIFPEATLFASLFLRMKGNEENERMKKMKIDGIRWHGQRISFKLNS
jgi:hypothetical protein